MNASWKYKRIYPMSLLHLVVLFSYLPSINCIHNWWNIGTVHFDEMEHVHLIVEVDEDAFGVLPNSKSSFDCQSFPGLSIEQKKLCQIYSDHMPVVSRAVKMGLEECQWQFRHRRWNCTLGNSTASFDFLPQAGTPEVSFVYSVMAASVVHSISRACREGELKTCGCSNKRRPASLPQDWLWQGCGDNSAYGYKFAVAFVDAREREKNYPRKTKELARMLVNLHNNEAGRRAVHAYTKPACKCHGVSGSCSVKTCWNQLPSLRETSNRLKERFDSATEVRFNQHGTNLVQRYKRFNRPTKEDLIYTDSPPDYCNPDLKTGSLGTVGRVCNRTSPGMDGCPLMCCGRGYYSRRVLVREKCHCKFQWCCFVKCKTCEMLVDVHTCK